MGISGKGYAAAGKAPSSGVKVCLPVMRKAIRSGT